MSGFLSRFEVNSVLGSITFLADTTMLYFLAFSDYPNIEDKIARFGKSIQFRSNVVIQNVSSQLDDYFAGKLKVFNVPVYFQGTSFQQSVWESLMKIPFGETRSYLDLAKMINYPKAFRAVALANAANNLSIIVPCHRVINHNGALGGYAGGVERKQWLFAHEAKFS